MYNNRKDNQMDKKILVVEVIKYKNIPTGYSIKKSADSLEEAAQYKVSLENLNEAENTTYELFNRFGQFEVEEIKKVEREETNEVRQ
jgi:hypothetical protein